MRIDKETPLLKNALKEMTLDNKKKNEPIITKKDLITVEKRWTQNDHPLKIQVIKVVTNSAKDTSLSLNNSKWREKNILTSFIIEIQQSKKVETLI